MAIRIYRRTYPALGYRCPAIARSIFHEDVVVCCIEPGLPEQELVGVVQARNLVNTKPPIWHGNYHDVWHVQSTGWLTCTPDFGQFSVPGKHFDHTVVLSDTEEVRSSGYTPPTYVYTQSIWYSTRDHGKWYWTRTYEPSKWWKRAHWVYAEAEYAERGYYVPDVAGMPTHPDQERSGTDTYSSDNWWYRYTYEGSLPTPSVEEATRIPFWAATNFDSAFYSKANDRISREYGWTNAVYKATDKARFLNINSISFIKETISLFRDHPIRENLAEARKVDEILRGSNSLKKKINTGVSFSASEYLSLHYGWKLSALDWSDIANASLEARLLREKAEPTQTCASLKHGTLQFGSDLQIWDPGLSELNWTRRCTLTIQSLSDMDKTVVEASDALVRRVLDLDILPTASNIWDLIPYSFVADWFTTIGDQLEARESGQYVDTLHPRRCIYTDLYEWVQNGSYIAPSGVIDANINWRYYTRKVEKTFRVDDLVIEQAGGMNPTHWVEAGALFIPRVLGKILR